MRRNPIAQMRGGTDGESLTVGDERSSHSPNRRKTDEVDSGPTKRNLSPKDESDFSQSDEEATDSDVDQGAGGDSPIVSRTRSRISSDQLLHQQPIISQRLLRSTQAQKNDRTQSSKANIKLEPPVLSRTDPSLKKGETVRRPAQEERRDTSNKHVAFIVMIVLLVCAALFQLFVSKPQAASFVEKTALTVFLDKFEQVEALFYGQQSALWKRSRITLRNQINQTKHEKPAILMFAAAWDGQQTMRCLARQIADAYSVALNATAMVEINSTVGSGWDSDVVKLEVDTQLSSGFDKGSKVAVVHHFQDMPPLSTLIFYKYCDHENAAYKAVALLLTVLLDEEKLAPDIGLRVLEMKVRDFLKRRFSSAEGSKGMDTDKLSGLWSRIAHVVLPVAPIREIEERGCDSKEGWK
ncbi:torsin-1A-interacting protein 2-like [Amblyraja radiata]|uniref:torsin-1A-interacting protein 2-like n=1 Tax=Amblyraja radiata TaxID=386614 RepID=UPI001401C1CA|nr:torsin-1A-interacting protein 2-like [Amblyraja radiata]